MPMAWYKSRPKNQQMAENCFQAPTPMEAGVAAVHGCSTTPKARKQTHRHTTSLAGACVPHATTRANCKVCPRKEPEEEGHAIVRGGGEGERGRKG